MTYAVRPLDESTWDAFAALVEANNGVFGGCWCMGFHGDDSRNDAGLNRERKLARVRAGTAHAALVFAGDDCVGWCQFGSPNELPRIKSLKEYEKGLADLPDWRIACNFVGKGHRRRGVASAALAGALERFGNLPDSRLAEMGKAGRRWVERDFNPTIYRDRLLELYGSLTDSSVTGNAA